MSISCVWTIDSVKVVYLKTYDIGSSSPRPAKMCVTRGNIQVISTEGKFPTISLKTSDIVKPPREPTGKNSTWIFLDCVQHAFARYKYVNIQVDTASIPEVVATLKHAWAVLSDVPVPETVSPPNDELIPRPLKFDAPNRMSNVILKIGDEKLHVSKEVLIFYLSVHSPVFETLFFGDFAEKGKEEVEIKDVDCEEFTELLNVIYPGPIPIADLTVLNILKLADRFQMERVVDQAKMHLIQSNAFDALTKLLAADQYRLDSVRDHCLDSVTDRAYLVNVQRNAGYVNFSDDTKTAICDRIAKLTKAVKRKRK